MSETATSTCPRQPQVHVRDSYKSRRLHWALRQLKQATIELRQKGEEWQSWATRKADAISLEVPQEEWLPGEFTLLSVENL